jgi:hypothetical protein
MSVKERGADDELNRIDEELSDDPPGLLRCFGGKFSDPAKILSSSSVGVYRTWPPFDLFEKIFPSLKDFRSADGRSKTRKDG